MYFINPYLVYCEIILNLTQTILFQMYNIVFVKRFRLLGYFLRHASIKYPCSCAVFTIDIYFDWNNIIHELALTGCLCDCFWVGMGLPVFCLKTMHYWIGVIPLLVILLKVLLIIIIRIYSGRDTPFCWNLQNMHEVWKKPNCNSAKWNVCTIIMIVLLSWNFLL